jgi:archaellum component FlaC
MSRCKRCHNIKEWEGSPDFAPVDGYCSCIEDLQAEVEKLQNVVHKVVSHYGGVPRDAEYFLKQAKAEGESDGE